MLELTADAVDAVRTIVRTEAHKSPEASGLRLVGRTKGEETELHVSLARAPEDEDRVVEEGGARLFLDAVAASYLRDKRLDASTTSAGIRFTLSDQTLGS